MARFLNKDDLYAAGAIEAVTIPRALAAPSGLRWTPTGVNLLTSASGYAYSTDVSAPLFVITQRLYVDLTNVTGNASDSNAGTSQAAPLLNYAAARGKATTGTQIECFGHKADVIVKETASWTAPNANYRSINRELPFRVSLLRVASTTAPTWAATSGQPGVYETTISAADASSLIDMSIKVDMAARVQVPVGGTVYDQARYQAQVRAGPPAWQVPVLVASITAVAAQPGSRYHDGTKLYVQAADSRNLVGDTKMLPLAGGVFGRTTAGVNDRLQQWDGFDWIGGSVPMFVSTNSNTVTGCHFGFKRCSVQASAAGQNGGFQVVGGNMRVTLDQCAAWFNWNDGFNYHSASADMTTGAQVLEVGCLGGGNGTTGSTAVSDNDSTAHEACDVITVNPVFIGSSDRVVADINNARRWMLGGYVGAPVDSTGISLANVATADTAQIIAAGTQFGPAGTNAVGLRAEGSSSITCTLIDSGVVRSGNVIG